MDYYTELETVLKQDILWHDEDITPFIEHVKNRDACHLTNHSTNTKRQRIDRCIKREKFRKENYVSIDGVYVNIGHEPTFYELLDIMNVPHTEEELQDFEDSVCCPFLFYKRNGFYEQIKQHIWITDTSNYKNVLEHDISTHEMIMYGADLARDAPGYISVEDAKGLISDIEYLCNYMCQKCIYFTLCLLMYEATPIHHSLKSNPDLKPTVYKNHVYTLYLNTNNIDYLKLTSLILGENAAWYKDFIRNFYTYKKIYIREPFKDGFKRVTYNPVSLNYSMKNPSMKLEKAFMSIGEKLPKIYAMFVDYIVANKDIAEIDIEKVHEYIMDANTDLELAHIAHVAGLKYAYHESIV